MPSTHSLLFFAAVTAVGTLALADTQAQLEAQVAKLLKDGARYSALSAQGKGSVCLPDDRKPTLGVLRLEGPDQEHLVSLDCVRLDKDVRVKDIDSYEALSNGHRQPENEIDRLQMNEDGIALKVHNDTFWAIQPGPTALVLKMPLRKDAAGKKWDLFEHFEESYDLAEATFDALTPDAASAKAYDLAGGKKVFYDKVKASLTKQLAKEKADHDAALVKVTFPKAGKKDAKLLKVATDWIKEHESEIGIKAASVKKVVITSKDWSVRHDQDDKAVIVGRTMDATVGFVNEDGSCAFINFWLQEDYAGGGKYETTPYAAGFQSGTHEILCKNIK